MNKIQYRKPDEIEKRSFEIIRSEMSTHPPAEQLPVIMRVIHTTADFEYESSMAFSDRAIDAARNAIRMGAVFITDTNMALSGINKKALAESGCSAVCYMADEEVAREARERGVTRAVVSMEKASLFRGRPLIFVIGNAPTALLRLADLIKEGSVSPSLVIGVPVGFVNVIESKEKIMKTAKEYIVAKGRKGGSTVAAAICNALLYSNSTFQGSGR